MPAPPSCSLACSAPEHPRPTLATAFDTVAWREELAGWASVREDWLPSPYGPALAQVALCRVDPAGLPAVIGGDPDATCRVPGAAVPDTVGLLVTRGDTLSPVTSHGPSGSASARCARPAPSPCATDPTSTARWPGTARFA
ncbi:MAG: hypothetical protein H6691_02825 [Gemmatimonadales bacterium]|nr:hypothetical protein [Gemmatimonadales bacterium]